MSATHSLFRILLVHKHIGTTHTHTHGKRRKKHRRRDTEVLPFLCLGCYCQFGKEEYAYQHTHIVGHLRVQEETDIGKEHYQQRTPTVLLAVGEHKTHNDQRHPCDRVALTPMRGCDDDKEITRQRHSKRTRHTKPLAHLECPQQQEECTQVEQEDKERRMVAPRAQTKEPPERTKHLVYRIAAVAAYLIVGHTRKHRTRPERVVSRGLVILQTLVYGSGTSDTIARIDDFPLQRWPEIHSGCKGKNTCYNQVRNPTFNVCFHNYV